MGAPATPPLGVTTNVCVAPPAALGLNVNVAVLPSLAAFVVVNVMIPVVGSYVAVPVYDDLPTFTVA